MSGALGDVTVVDFSQMMQGPWATQKLADMGADVIKVEPPDGELQRDQTVGGETQNGVSLWYLAMNRNKRSLAVDLKSAEGRDAVRELVAEADVVVENFRPGVMDRLGFGYDDVCEYNEDVVYVSATGYGEDGPYETRPAQDLLIQAMSGLANLAGQRDDPPTPSGTFVADELSATLIALHAVIALYHRERTGEGQKVEANLLNAMIDGLCQEVTGALTMDRSFERSEAGISHPFMSAPYGVYETADGHVAISIGDVEDLADLLDADALRSYDTPAAQYDHRDEIYDVIAEAVADRQTANLVDALLSADVWAAAVSDLEALEDDPQVEHNDMIVEMEHPVAGDYATTGIPVGMSETPGEIRSPPPMAGEHTREVLSGLGYGSAEIDRLAARGVVTLGDDE